MPGGGETERSPSGWTVDTLSAHVEMQFSHVRELLNDLRVLLDERYDTQTKALDAAFASAEKAVNTALLAAEKAVNKAEGAANTRFEAMNEFRGQLADQAATLMPRSEAEQRANTNTEKIVDLSSQLNTALAQINSRLDLTAGGASGADKYRTTLFALIAAAAAIVGLAFALFGK